MPFERDPDEIGALWAKEGRGGSYFSGTVNGQAIVVFKNTKKVEGSKAPDYRILKARPQASRVDDDFGGDFR